MALQAVHVGFVAALCLGTAPPSPTTAPAPAPGSNPAPKKAASGSAFDVRARGPDDPYGERPAGAPGLKLDQIVRYALDNPAIRAAEEEVAAMRAQLRKAKFAWIPTINTTTTLAPGASVNCDDITLDDGTVDGFDFQFCRAANQVDIQTVRGYFSQLARAGVRFEFRADMVIPITTFGKLRNVKKASEVGLAIKQLQKLQVEHETVLRVHQAHATLLAAREAIGILKEARRIVDGALKRVEKDLGGSEDWDADPGDSNADRDPDDLYKVKLARLDVEQLMRQALKVDSLALSALWALAGKAAPRGFDVDEDDLRALPIDGGLKDLRDYKQLAVRHRPEARMASAAVKAREYQERLARANFLPDLGILVTAGVARSSSADLEMSQLYYQDGFNFSRLTALLALRWKWDFHFKAFDLQSARAIKRAAEYREEAARLLLGRDVEEAYGDLNEARHNMTIYVEGIDLAWKLVVSGQQKDTVSGGNAGELLRHLKKWYEMRFEHARAIQAHNDALARLSRAVGTQLSRTSSPLPKADTSLPKKSVGGRKPPKRSQGGS